MAKKKRQRYSRAFKERVIGRMQQGERVRGLSLELQIAQSVLFGWRKEAEQRPGNAKDEQAQREKERDVAVLEARIEELEAAVGRKALEVDFLASALRRLEASGPKDRAGEKPSGLKSAAGWVRKAD